MKMQEWIDALDNQIVLLQRKLLTNNGKVSHKQAIEKGIYSLEKKVMFG